MALSDEALPNHARLPIIGQSPCGSDPWPLTMPAISAVLGLYTRAVLRSGIGLLTVQFIAILRLALDAILIERAEGLGESANHAELPRLFGLVAMVTGIGLRPLWPAYADARARGNYAWIGKTFSRSLVATAVVAGGLSIVLAVLAGVITARCVGNAIKPPASLVTAFAAWLFVLACGMAFSYVLERDAHAAAAAS